MTARANSPRTLFDLDLLRAMVMVADCGSFTAAAARLHSTQSTVSQQIRRLEDIAGRPLLVRANRDVHPTDAGHALLGIARQMLALNDQMREVLAGATVAVTVRLGVPEDFVSRRTSTLLGRFNRRHPHVKLEVTSGLSRDLAQAFDHGELDLAVVKQRRASRPAMACWPEPMRWVDSARTPCLQEDPVPLVTFPPRGLYRDELIAAMESQGKRWRISFTSSSLSGIQGAVADGMGISLLPARAVTRDHRVLGARQGFSPMDGFEVALLHRPAAEPIIVDLATQFARLLDRGQR
ncbi:LysR substrate-binding domain-containing protein [Stenotrophomonas oahuensis]|uniref:LysR substrate-binding domain-containing protein n=1 Tax=Stenotrophomonas oahuensis TaxID=3003271 RepID=A0ABY9YM63_9GAMM|nr:LysR substrate-binding domain-containing protein [Stenotrophomonas sp. A5586]WNH51984.1 LysR substrate-binding domain-containing protein [Stenotrophomonas sp. A5586]